MEMLIYFKSLGRYFCESPEHIREELVNELRDRLHRSREKGTCSLQLADVIEDSEDKVNKLARLIVRDPDAPASLLNRLAGSLDKEVLERIAEHPRASGFTLAELARSQYHEVRVAVADNANTPTNVLHDLVDDEHVDVRYRLAENPSICVSVLLRLEDDENPYVSMRAGITLERMNFGYRAQHAA
jgi:predicted nucleotidyltransferase